MRNGLWGKKKRVVGRKKESKRMMCAGVSTKNKRRERSKTKFKISDLCGRDTAYVRTSVATTEKAQYS